MNRLNRFGVLTAIVTCVSALSFAFLPASVVGDQDAHKDHAQDSNMAAAQKTAQSCYDCVREVNKGFHHCVEQLAAGKKEYSKALQACADMAILAGACGDLCGRSSPMMGYSAEACARGCDDCAAECEKLKDSAMASVVTACRKSAADCREMVKMMAGGKK